jgi:hypothetical protein
VFEEKSKYVNMSMPLCCLNGKIRGEPRNVYDRIAWFFYAGHKILDYNVILNEGVFESHIFSFHQRRTALRGSHRLKIFPAEWFPYRRQLCGWTQRRPNRTLNRINNYIIIIIIARIEPHME